MTRKGRPPKRNQRLSFAGDTTELTKPVPKKRSENKAKRNMNDTSSIIAAAPSANDGASTSTCDATKKSPGKQQITDFDLSATSFPEIVTKLIYIDKSLFIKAIFDNKCKYHLITAPRRFGKSTILDMIKCFVEREAKEKRNRRLFEKKLYDGSTSLKIMNEKEIVNTHFGQYPVIHVDFKCDDVIDSFEVAVDWCKDVVQAAFIEHEYLIDSLCLKNREKKICEEWINDLDKIRRKDVIAGLKNLSKFLFNHYKGKGVFLLVDEYDSVIMNALFEVDGVTLGRIAKFCNGILSAVLKRSDGRKCYKEGNDEEKSEYDTKEYQKRYVERAIITGISHIAGVGISGLNNVQSDPFLRQTQFLDYYGLTESEIDELLSRLKFKGNEISREDLQYYNGYVSKNGTSIYPLWSVLNCLQNQEKRQYYAGTGTIVNLSNAFQTPSVRSKVQQLVLGLNVSIRFHDKISLRELTGLRNQFLEPELGEISLYDDIFFSFLFEQGYLTYGPGKYPKKDGFEKVDVRIPNEEIKEVFQQDLAIFYVDFCKLNEKKREVCRKSFETLIELANNYDVNFIVGVEQLHRELEGLLKDALSQKTCLRLNEAALHTSVCFVFLQSDFRFTTEYMLPNGKRLDLAVVKGDCGIVFEFKFDSGQSSGTKANDALQQIKTNEYTQVFENENILKPLPGKIILMGLSFNNDKDLTIACKIDKKRMKTVYIPNKEKAGISRESSSKRKGKSKTGQRAKITRRN